MSSLPSAPSRSRTKGIPVFEPEAYGAVPDAKTLNTEALQRAIDACAAAGGGTVVCKCGIYRTGTLVLKSRVTLHLEAGATLLASGELKHYQQKYSHAVSLIFAENAEDVGIRGPGCIDGNGDAFWEKLSAPYDWAEAKKSFSTWIPHFDYAPKARPRALVLFANCTNVRVEDLHIKDSFHWTILLLACTGGLLRRVKIRNCIHGPNTDGINLDACSDVLVDHCDILTGDDAVALKNTHTWKLKRPSSNITVRNCILRSPAHGFTIGTETRDDFENISFTNCEISRAGDCRTMTGIGLSILDGGSIRGVNVSNIRIMGAVAPIQIRLGNAGRGQSIRSPGSLSDIHIKDVTSFGASGVCMLTGLAGHPLTDVSLSDITLETEGGVPEDRILKAVPVMDEEYPLNNVWRFLPAYGFYCRHARRLTFSNVKVTASAPDSRPAFVFDQVTNLCADGLKEKA